MSQDNEFVLDCGHHLTIKVLKNQHQALCKAFTKKKSFLIKADQVEKADTAALQLLLSIQFTAIKNNLSINWQDPTQALINQAKLLGLSDHLKLTESKGKNHVNRK